MRPLLRPRRALAAAAACLSLLAPAAAQQPSFDANSLLDSITGGGSGKAAQFFGGNAAFLPERAVDDGSKARRERTKDRVWVVVEKDGAEVIRWKCQVRPLLAVFNRVSAIGSPSAQELPGAGSYRISALYDDEPIASVPFTVESISSGDPFDPKTTLCFDADLMRWAQVRIVNPKSDRPTVQIAMRIRGGEFDLGPKDRIEMEIRENGRVIYDCGEMNAAGLRGHTAWLTTVESVSFPRSQAGGPVPYADFVKKDGTYELIARRGDEVLRAYRFRVDGGRLVPHARSSFSHEPRAEFLLPRVPINAEGEGVMDLTWMEPLSTSDLASAGAAAAAPVPAAMARASWKPASPAPDRAPSVVLTNVAARVDAHIAAGRDLVAYGTGAVRGVAYLRCGEDQEVTFAGGSDVSSKVFFVCGTKLVLIKNRQVVVHDTANGETTEIPEATVHLARTPTEFTKGRAIDADGMLVAVLCDPTKTDDRRSVKVIDLSGAAPEVISLGLPDADPSHLVSVAVDAAGGTVVVGSDRRKALFAAPIAADAAFRTLDLSAHDGLPRDCAPIVRGGVAAVFDATGSRQLRLVDLDSGSVSTVAELAKAERWFDFDGSKVALAGATSNGGSYAVLVGEAGAAPAAPGGSGDGVGNGKKGYGQRVVLAGEGLVFTSGSGKGGLGSGEFLHVTGAGGWATLTQDGAPLAAVDVIAGEHLVAFKTGRSRDARVGYVLLGRGTTAEMLAR